MKEHNHNLQTIPIIKGNKIIGNNHFCTDFNCKYEKDTGVKEHDIY